MAYKYIVAYNDGTKNNIIPFTDGTSSKNREESHDYYNNIILKSTTERAALLLVEELYVKPKNSNDGNK